jgi:hypothetical protein
MYICNQPNPKISEKRRVHHEQHSSDRSRRLWLTFFDRRANPQSASAEWSSRNLTDEGMARIRRADSSAPPRFGNHLRVSQQSLWCKFIQRDRLAIRKGHLLLTGR